MALIALWQFDKNVLACLMLSSTGGSETNHTVLYIIWQIQMFFCVREGIWKCFMKYYLMFTNVKPT